MSFYSDRIPSMSAAYGLNLAVAGLIAATSVGVAGPAGLVESVVTQSASTNVMSYVETGKTFRLGPQDTMVLSYPDACLRETITGGTVTIGIDQSEVQGGQVARKARLRFKPLRADWVNGRGTGPLTVHGSARIAKIAKPTVETSVKVRLNLEKFVWSSREK
jgi:hypothetical protein